MPRWRNKPFVFGLVIFLFTWVSVDILQAILLFFIKYVVLMESSSDLIMATIFIVAILALPVWNWASRRWNKRKAYIVGIGFLGGGAAFSRQPGACYAHAADPLPVRAGRHWRFGGACAALVDDPRCD